MIEQEILRIAKEVGIENSAFMNAKDLVFEFEFRKYCEMNQCGNFGKNYGCPPDCGTPAEMKDKVMKYSRALVLQNIQPVGDITDSAETGSLKKRHNAKIRIFINELEAKGIKGMAIMAGPCSACSPCAKVSGEPCRFPEKRASCLSAYGINVAELCKTCGLSWDHGKDKVGFFGIYMMD